MAEPVRVIGDIEQPLFLAGADSTLGQVAGKLTGGEGVLVERDDGYFAVLAREVAGYPASRLLADLPLVELPALPATTSLAAALALMEERAAPGLVVLREGRPGGWASRERLLEAVLAEARRAELLADLLQNVIVTYNYDSHTAKIGIFGSPNCQRVDIKASGGKHTSHMGQNARLILN